MTGSEPHWFGKVGNHTGTGGSGGGHWTFLPPVQLSYVRRSSDSTGMELDSAGYVDYSQMALRWNHNRSSECKNEP